LWPDVDERTSQGAKELLEEPMVETVPGKEMATAWAILVALSIAAWIVLLLLAGGCRP
jgi:hypothetical protein